MDNEIQDQGQDQLIPKAPERLAPQGIRTFTVYRAYDSSGISGEGVVIEGIILGTGQCVVHWLYPPPRGSIAMFDSMNDFIGVHIGPHPKNKTIITYQDGEKRVFGEVDPEIEIDTEIKEEV
jgi:hypothetical protein